jgi:hypothetical protein
MMAIRRVAAFVIERDRYRTVRMISGEIRTVEANSSYSRMSNGGVLSSPASHERGEDPELRALIRLTMIE